MHRSRHLSYGLIALIAFASSACSGGGDGGGTTGPGAVAKVGVSSTAFTFVAIGASQAVSASVTDAQDRAISSAPVSWTSDDPAIAVVTASGRTATIVAKKSGTTVIHAASGQFAAAINIVVLGVKTVAVTPASVTIRSGETQVLSADVTADAGVSRSVNWTSSNNAVATVNATGVVTALSPGSVTITASAVADPAITGTAVIQAIPQRGVAVNPPTATLATGGTQQLTSSVVVDAGVPTTVTWTSSAPAIATVNGQGLVTGVAFGNATITATSTADNSLKGTAAISVVPVVRQIAVAPPAAAPFYIGLTQTLVANVTADAGVATSVNWTSSNSTVASVSASGVVTANAVGTAVITATSTADAGKSAEVNISVASRPVGITVNLPIVAVTVGNSATVVATVTADPAVSKAVTWTTSAASIATVSNGVVTGVSNGAAVITAASVADPTKTATVSVTVGQRLATSWSGVSLGGALVENVVSTYAVNSNNVFAVNSRGDILRFDGTTWTRVVQGATFNTMFKAIHGTSASNVVAVGTGGKIATWNGAAWQSAASGTSSDLNDVWVESATTAFAVGNGGIAVRLTGTSWAASITGSTQKLNAVWNAGSNTWFAVGDNGELLRWVSGTWQRMNSPVAVNMHDVYGTATNDVYAVGDVGTVLRWNGSAWSMVNSNGVASDLYTLSGTTVGGTKLYVGGDRVALQLVGNSLDPLPNDAPYLVQFFSSSVDASGALWLSGERGVVLRSTNAIWATMNIAPDLIDVWATSTTNAWAVGEFGFIYRYDGITWSKQTSPTTTRLNTVWASSASDAFAGGDGGLMLRWNGSSWSPIASPTTGDILSLWGTSSQNVYASTFNGQVLRFNGTSWSVVTSQTNPLYAVFGSGANDVYVAGDGGTVLKFDGTAWSTSGTGSNALLAGIWASAPNNVFSVGILGSSAAGFRFGTAWQTMNVGTSVELTSVWGSVPTDVYVSGANGTILRFDGVTWQGMPTGSTEYLWSLTGAPDGSGAGFAVGFNSTLIVGSKPSARGATTKGVIPNLPGSLEPSHEALMARHGTVRALPQGAARRSITLSHAASLKAAGSREQRP